MRLCRSQGGNPCSCKHGSCAWLCASTCWCGPSAGCFILCSEKFMINRKRRAKPQRICPLGAPVAPLCGKFGTSPSDTPRSCRCFLVAGLRSIDLVRSLVKIEPSRHRRSRLDTETRKADCSRSSYPWTGLPSGVAISAGAATSDLTSDELYRLSEPGVI